MPTFAVTMSVPEMDAAEALLELRFDRDSSPNGERPSRSRHMLGNEMESTHTATLFLNGVSSGSNVELNPNPNISGPTIFALDNGNGLIIRRNTSSSYHYTKHLKPPKKRSIFRKKEREHKYYPEASSTPESEFHHEKSSKKLLDKSTQTEVEYQLPQIQKMESVITELCAKIRSLEGQLQAGHSGVGSLLDDVAVPGNARTSYDRKAKTSESIVNKLEFEATSGDDDDDDRSYVISETKASTEEAMSEQDSEREYTIDNGDVVPIGDGNAVVPSRLLRQLDWSSYTNVTRKLLTAVFSRRVLATHSLTGKRSPAFPDKPAKKKLNSALVNDIIQTVVERCHVPENVVRTSITTKCADESKMLRTRQKNKKLVKKENIPPRTTSSSSTGSGASRL